MALKHSPVKLAIVGGGAAGMFAAATAQKFGVPCLVIERKARLGSKVLMTANGRCNFAKDIAPDVFLKDIQCSPSDTETKAISRFLAPSVNALPPRRIISFFKALNVPVRRMADGRMFPADGKATTIVHAFGDLLRNSEIPVLTNCAVTGIQPMKNGFVVATKNFTLWAENVLIATGGASYPKLGSVGDGQRFAAEMKHRVTALRAGLIGLETDDRRIVSRAGRRYEDSRAILFSPDGQKLFEHRGEVDCEAFGLSGAAIYNCQRHIAHSGLKDYVIEVWLDRERLQFRNLRSRPLKEAIVTVGGVSRDDIDPQTMRSRIVPNLYFAGEVIDIDGPTGGYNLTMAFSTAFRAVADIASAKA